VGVVDEGATPTETLTRTHSPHTTLDSCEVFSGTRFPLTPPTLKENFEDTTVKRLSQVTWTEGVQDLELRKNGERFVLLWIPPTVSPEVKGRARIHPQVVHLLNDCECA